MKRSATGSWSSASTAPAACCAGYWNNHEQTKATIEGHWIRTGDKYHQDADGFFWHAGRSDDMLKVGGIWVSPVEVEHALATHDVVVECAVVGRLDRDGLTKPAAYVVVRQDVDGTHDLASELQQFVARRLAEYKRPRWVEFVPELPKTATGRFSGSNCESRDVERARVASLGEIVGRDLDFVAVRIAKID